MRQEPNNSVYLAPLGVITFYIAATQILLLSWGRYLSNRPKLTLIRWIHHLNLSLLFFHYTTNPTRNQWLFLWITFPVRREEDAGPGLPPSVKLSTGKGIDYDSDS